LRGAVVRGGADRAAAAWPAGTWTYRW